MVIPQSLLRVALRVWSIDPRTGLALRIPGLAVRRKDANLFRHGRRRRMRPEGPTPRLQRDGDQQSARRRHARRTRILILLFPPFLFFGFFGFLFPLAS